MDLPDILMIAVGAVAFAAITSIIINVNVGATRRALDLNRERTALLRRKQ